MVFHRDSESGHIARETIQFTDKEEWMPKPQEMPRWISVCGEFSSAFTKAVCHINKFKRMNGINLTKNINKILESWPKRCKLI